MVILAPMFQLGCLRASALVLPRSSSVFMPKNGPPDAVSRILVRLGRSPCPAGTGRWRSARCPRQQLHAVLCHRPGDQMAAGDKALLVGQGQIVAALDGSQAGTQPAMPTTLFSTTSGLPARPAPAGPRAGEQLGALARPDSAASSLAAASGRSCRRTLGGILRSAAGSSPHGCGPTGRTPHTLCRITSRLWVPMEPVEPSSVIFFDMATSLSL